MSVIRIIFLSLLISCITTCALAQKAKKKAAEEDEVFTKVETEGGTNMQEWNNYMRKSAVLPSAVAKKIPPGTYKVYIRFVIDVHGELSDIKADNDPGYDLVQRALRIFKDYKGEWQPANQCGRLVKSYKKMTVIFVVPAG